MSGSFRLALIQLSVGANKAANLSRAAIKVKEAASQGAQVVSLPECFNSPYGTVSVFLSIVMFIQFFIYRITSPSMLRPFPPARAARL